MQELINVIKLLYSYNLSKEDIIKLLKSKDGERFIKGRYTDKDIRVALKKVADEDYKQELVKPKLENLKKENNTLVKRNILTIGKYNSIIGTAGEVVEKGFQSDTIDEKTKFFVAKDIFKSVRKEDLIVAEEDKRVNLTDVYSNTFWVFKKILDSDLNYFIVKGGRGSGKSLGLVNLIIIASFDSNNANSKILCFRYFQNSIASSIYSLLALQISEFNLNAYFNITKVSIINKVTNVEIIFKGVVDPEAIKSTANISLAIGEEGQQFTSEGLETVMPTIRRTDGKPTKTIIGLNPTAPLDSAVAFAERQGKENCEIFHWNIYELPKKWQNQQLLQQAESDRIHRPELYKHKWLGEPSPDFNGCPLKNIFTLDYELNSYEGMDVELPTDRVGSQMFIDPAFTGLNDTTAVTIAWIPHSGSRYSNYVVVYGVCYELNYVASAEHIVKLAKHFKVKHIKYECNGGAQPFDRSLAAELTKIGYNEVLIEGVYSREPKTIRINRLIGVVNKLAFINTKENQTYIQQIKDYDPRKSVKSSVAEYKDDAPDSLASFINNYYAG